jgi:hypothetical protein
MADILSDNYTCLQIKFVSDRVDRVEHAAEHPYMQDFAEFDFTDPNEIIERLAYVGDEFDLSPEQVLEALRISQSAVQGEDNNVQA